MTEVPEHLLKRSRDRKGGAGGAGSAEGAPTEPSASAAGAALEPAASKAVAKPAAAVPAKAAKAPEPVPPYVEASLKRKRIPIWAMPVLALLPLWAVIYVATLTPAGEAKKPQLVIGADVYSARCASCHGADGAGGVGRPFKAGEVLKTFPKIGEQLEFVWLGSNGMGPAGTPYGDPEREGGQHKTLSFNGNAMPTFKGVITQEELLAVVRYERETLAGEKLDAKATAADGTRNNADGTPMLDAKGETLIGPGGKPLFGADGKLASTG